MQSERSSVFFATRRDHHNTKQGVTLTGRNRTGPPLSVGHPSVHAPGPAAADCLRARRPARRPPAALQTTDDRRQRAKQYWFIRRASNNDKRSVKTTFEVWIMLYILD